MPAIIKELTSIVNYDKAKEAGAGPLLLAWARRTQNGLDSTDRQVEVLDSIDPSAPYYEYLGGDVMSKWAKALVSEAPVFIDVLGLPYGGPNNGRDNDGEYFSPLTDFMDGVIDTPAVFYVHGTTNNKDADTHGKVHARWYDEQGGWFKISLDRNSPRFDQLYSAHKTNNLRASSGVVPASRIVSEDGHVDRWLVGELSLVDLRDGFKPSNGYAITKATPDVVFETYYGDPVKEGSMGLLERINQAFNTLREDIASMIAGESLEDTELGKCEACDQEAAEEAENLRKTIATMKAEEENKPKECLPCRAAVKWVGTMVKASKMTLDEALEAVNRFEVDATGWETLKDEVEARDTTLRVALSKAYNEGKEITIVSGNVKDSQTTVDPAYMERMRSQVTILGKK